MVNKIASWPKWATEDSINKLNANISVGNKQIIGLLSQMAKNTGSSTTVKGTTIDQSKPIITEFQRGFRTLNSTLNTTNILLNLIYKQTSKGIISNSRSRPSRSAGMNSPGFNTDGFFNSMTDHMIKMQEKVSEAAKEAAQEEVKAIYKQRDEEDLARKRSAAEESVINARTWTDKIAAQKKLADVEKEIERKKAGYSAQPAKPGINIGGLGSMFSGGVSWKNTINSLGASLVPLPGSLGKFNAAILGANAIIGALIPVATELFKIWKDGALQTSTALDRGLEGLTASVLSFAINAKSAGLTAEQFSKILSKSNGGLSLMDSNYQDSGKAFATGTKEFLDQADKFNYFGQMPEDLAENFRRAADLVGAAGIRGKKAIDTAREMAISESSEIYRLTLLTGKSAKELQGAFDNLYKDDLFRMASTNFLAKGEKAAAQEFMSTSKALASIGGDLASKLQDELDISTIGGFDPTQMGGAFTQLAMILPQFADALRDMPKNLSEDEKRDYMGKAAKGISQNDLAQIAQLSMADPEMKSILKFIQRAKETRDTNAPRGAFPNTEGARQLAATIRLTRSIEKLNANILGTIDRLGVMNLFKGLANGIAGAVEWFDKLPDAVKDVIIAFGGIAAMLAGSAVMGAAGRGLGRMLGRGAAGAAAGEAGAAAGTTSSKGPVRSLYDKIFNSGKYAPVDMKPGTNAVPYEGGPASTGPAGAAGFAGSSALKNISKGAKGGGIAGAIIGGALNELTEVQDLKTARQEVIEEYKNGNIKKEDAIKAIKAIDDKIAGSRGGSISRGASSGAAGAATGAALGSIFPGLGTLAGAGAGLIGGYLFDLFFGDTTEAVGSAAGSTLFGGNEKDIGKELDALRPLASTEGPNAQPGAINTPSGVTDPTMQGNTADKNNAAAQNSANAERTFVDAQMNLVDNTQQLMQLQRQANQLLAAILDVQSQMQADTRKSTDSLEMLNNKM